MALLPSTALRPTAGATKMVVLEASGAGEAELFAGLATSSEGGGRVPGAKASAANGTRSSSQGASQVFLTNRNFCKLVSLARRRWRTGWRCFSSGVAGILLAKPATGTVCPCAIVGDNTSVSATARSAKQYCILYVESLLAGTPALAARKVERLSFAIKLMTQGRFVGYPRYQ